MMKVIHKQRLTYGEQTFKLPAFTKIVDFGTDLDGHLAMWFERRVEDRPRTDYRVRVIQTGEYFTGEYIGRTVFNGLIYHLVLES